MEKIRAAARNFWPGFSFADSIFAAALREHYKVELVERPEIADVVFESHWSPPRTLRNRLVENWKNVRKLKFRGKQIFFSGEPYPIPVGEYHGVISHHLLLKENHFRLPLWVLYCKLWPNVGGRQTPDADADFTPDQLVTPRLTKPTKFACEIFGVPHHMRFKIPQYLEQFGHVELLGRAVGKPVESKMAVMSDYKFNLCFENTVIAGYVTEKPLQAKMAGCIPLWWGHPAYREDFNEKALINLFEYDFDFQRVLDTVDLEEVRHTPLLNSAPTNLLSEMGDFIEGVMRAPGSSVF